MLVILILSSITVLATVPEPKEGGVLSIVPTCSQEGRLSLTISAFDIPSEFWVYTDEIDVWLIDEKGSAVNINDKGAWDSVRIKDAQDITQRTATFTTEIDTIHDPGDYKIRLNYKAGAAKEIDKRSRDEVEYEQEKAFHCDGYIFSCSALLMNVDSCTSDGNALKIVHTVNGLTQSPQATIDLSSVIYRIQAEKPYTDTEGKTSTFGGTPISSKTTMKGDQFILEAPFEDNNIEAVTVSYDISINRYTKECLQGVYISASAICNKAEEVKEQKEEQKAEEVPAEEPGLEGITGAAVSDVKTYSTKTKLLIAAIVVLIVIIIGYYATREKKDESSEEEQEKK